jgi:hypothetical protein
MGIEARLQAFTAGTMVAVACALALFARGSARAAEPPTPVELYRQALVVMNDLKEPAFVTYRLDGTSEGLRADLKSLDCDSREITHLQFTYGSNAVRWALRHRTADSATEIVDTANGRRYVGNLDPTWLTTYRRLRNPPLRFGSVPCPSPSPRSEPTPAPPASPGPVLKTIGTVVAIGPGIYNVEDRGAVACPSGEPGHALHLWSRTNNPSQTLSDVVIELRSMRFCTIRFGVRGGAGVGGTGIYEQHFADIGGYWMMTDGLVDVTARVVGIAAGHGVWRYRYSDFTFPDSLPADVFVPPATH